MAAAPSCSICKSRRARRSCPVEGEICSQCCGAGRENTIACPIDCLYLIEATAHERPPGPMDEGIHADVRVEQRFVAGNELLFDILAMAIAKGALDHPELIDTDIRDCLDAAILRRKASGSGLVYDAVPVNRVAAALLEKFEANLKIFNQERARDSGGRPSPDVEVLWMLVFMIRMCGTFDNGRRRGRMFLRFILSTVAKYSEDAGELASN